MGRRWIVAVVMAGTVGTVALPACSTTTSKRDPAKPTLPRNFGDVNRAACDSDRTTLEVAIEAFHAMNGDETVPTEADLVAAGLLRTESTGYDIDPTGALTPTAGGLCA